MTEQDTNRIINNYYCATPIDAFCSFVPLYNFKKIVNNSYFKHKSSCLKEPTLKPFC